jgi:hypothetical protein
MSVLGAALITLALAAGPACAETPSASPTAADTAAPPLAGASGWMLVAAGSWLLALGMAVLFFVCLFRAPGRRTPMWDGDDPLRGPWFERELEEAAARDAAKRRERAAAEEARRAEALGRLAEQTEAVLGNEARRPGR